MKKIKFFIWVIRWQIKHRGEKNNQQKQRRFGREAAKAGF